MTGKGKKKKTVGKLRKPFVYWRREEDLNLRIHSCITRFPRLTAEGGRVSNLPQPVHATRRKKLLGFTPRRYKKGAAGRGWRP